MSGGGSNSSSRKSKKSSSQNSDKPKQPQRGLGVAQLEKIRLHSQIEEIRMQAFHAMHSSMGGAPPASHFGYSQYGYPHNVMMGMGDLERSEQRFGESQTYQPWLNPSHVYPDKHHYGPAGVATRHLLNNMENSGQDLRNGWFEMAGSSSQNTDDSQDLELDLELKL